MSRPYLDACIPSRVGNFRQNNYSTEDGIDRTIGLFLRNSVCSVEKNSLGILFQTVRQRRKMLRKRYHGTKIEANSRNSFLSHSMEQKTLGIPFQIVPQMRKMLRSPFHG
jgi:hypothetical protein